MKKILATSILFTLFVTAVGCGHNHGAHKQSHGEASCAGGHCDTEAAQTAAKTEVKKDEKKRAGCAECNKGS